MRKIITLTSLIILIAVFLSSAGNAASMTITETLALAKDAMTLELSSKFIDFASTENYLQADMQTLAKTIIDNAFNASVKNTYFGNGGAALGYEINLGKYTSPTDSFDGEVAATLYIFDGPKSDRTYSSLINVSILIKSKYIFDEIKNKIYENINYLAYGHTSVDANTANLQIKNQLSRIVLEYPTVVYDVSGNASSFIASETGTSNNFFGKDGKYTCEITINYKGISSVVKNFKIPVNAKQYPAIYKFNESAFIKKWDLPSGNTLTLEPFYKGKSNVAKLTTAVNGYAHMTIPFHNDSELLKFDGFDYPYYVISYMASHPKSEINSGNPTSFQNYFYTDHYSGGHAYYMYPTNPNSYNTWCNEIRDFNLKSSFSGTAVGNYSWGFPINSFRVDFMRYTTNVERTAYIDYIAFFPTLAEAQAYVADNSIYSNGSLTALQTKAQSIDTSITIPQSMALTKVEVKKATIDAIKSKVTDPTIYVTNCELYAYKAPQVGTAASPNGVEGSAVALVTLNEYIYCANVVVDLTIPAIPYARTQASGITLGAQIRTNGVQGLRFGTRVFFNAFSPAEKIGGQGITNLSYGTLILPAKCFELNNSDYTNLKHSNIKNGKLFDKTVADVQGEKIYLRNTDYIDFTAVITDIPLDKYNLRFVARGYVKYSSDNGQTFNYYYFDPLVKSINDVNNSLEEKRLSSNRFRIGAYTPHTIDIALGAYTEEYIASLAELGIDYSVLNSEYLRSGTNEFRENFFKLYAKYGIETVIHDPYVYKTYLDASIYDKTKINAMWYNDYTAFAGISLVDEPGIEHFRELGRSVAEFNKFFPNKMAYINLLPMYASAAQLTGGAWKSPTDYSTPPTTTYQQHLDSYVQFVPTSYICADIYPCYKDNKTYQNYAKSIEIIANTCRKSNRDLWVVIQSCSYGASVREPDKADMYWQAYTCLSYGTTTLLYYVLSDFSTHKGSPYDATGAKTQLWYDMKSLNAEIKAISETYLQYKNLGAYNHNSSVSETPYLEMNTPYSGFSNVITEINCPVPLMIGAFERKVGKGFAFTLVNMKPFTTPATAIIKIKVNGNSIISYQGGIATPLSKDNNGYYNITLEQGMGAFFTID